MEENIQNIVFDVGNVLIDFCWKEACERLHFSEDVIERLATGMVLTNVWDQLDEGTIELEDAIHIFISRMPDLEQEIRLFWEHADDIVKEYDYAKPMIEKWKEKGKKVYLLSNYPLEMYRLHWKRFHFFPYVDGYIVSAVEKMRKPDIRIYQLLCERYQLNPSECFFFDDRQENVDAAIHAGMKAELFTGYETVAKYL